MNFRWKVPTYTTIHLDFVSRLKHLNFGRNLECGILSRKDGGFRETLITTLVPRFFKSCIACFCDSLKINAE